MFEQVHNKYTGPWVKKKIDETCNGFLEIIQTVFDKHVFFDTGVIVRDTCSQFFYAL